MARRLKAETYRRLVLGDLRHLGRLRYGTPLPDDDAGRDHIEAQLRHCSGVMEMRFEVTKYAPWLGREAGSLIARISSMPSSLMSMRQLGEEFRVTNEERNRHKLYRIRPVDMSDEQLAEQRKAKERERLERRRRSLGAEVREVWLAANSISRAKPWEQLGMSRRQWYRKGKPQPPETGVYAELNGGCTEVTGDTRRRGSIHDGLSAGPLVQSHRSGRFGRSVQAKEWCSTQGGERQNGQR